MRWDGPLPRVAGGWVSIVGDRHRDRGIAYLFLNCAEPPVEAVARRLLVRRTCCNGGSPTTCSEALSGTPGARLTTAYRLGDRVVPLVRRWLFGNHCR